MVYVFLADGFEELEAIAPLDILKRARIDVKTVGVDGEFITSSMGLTIKTDLQINNVTTKNLEGIILPGGMPGTINLDKNPNIHNIINYCVANNLLIGAICAAPTILGKIGILKNKKACCYPGCEPDLKDSIITNDDVCVDNNIITARGPGVAIKFGFTLLRFLKNDKAEKVVKNSMQYSTN